MKHDIIKSRYSDVHIPEVPLHDYVFRDFHRFGNKTAIVCGETGRGFTFKQLDYFTKNVACGLLKLGLRKGDVVAMVCPNIPEFAIFMFGCLRAGLTISTINPAYTKDEISKQLNDCSAKWIFTVNALQQVIQESLKNLTIPINGVIVVGDVNGWIPFKQLMQTNGPKTMLPSADATNSADDVAFIPYSSGTTGIPKGVLLTHRNIIANLAQNSHDEMEDPLIKSTSDGDEQESLLALVPFFHSYGLVILLCLMLHRGCKIVTMPRFVPDVFLQAIQDQKISILPLVPPLVVFLAKSPLVRMYDLSSVKRVFCGAAPLTSDTVKEFQERLNVGSLLQGYGLTEASPSVTTPIFTPEAEKRPGHSGALIPNTEARIVNLENGSSCDINERGELWIRGPQIMKGYLNRPEATAEMLDSEGWLHTGDVAYYDDQGLFYIVDRIKELIKYKAFQVAPAELESLLLTHPGVADVGVIGIPDEEAGELPAAIVVRRDGTNLTEKEVFEFAAKQTASFKQLKGGVFFVSEIPKSPSGKILRRILREFAEKKLNTSSKL